MHNPEIAILQSMTRPFLKPDEVALVLQCTPQSIRTAARQRPELLGFPVNIMGNRVRIPRVPFLQFLCGKEVST